MVVRTGRRMRSWGDELCRRGTWDHGSTMERRQFACLRVPSTPPKPPAHSSWGHDSHTCPTRVEMTRATARAEVH
jgi:hypothetical protein